jgi:hypothetical protein
MLPLSKEVLVEELDTAQRYLTRLLARVQEDVSEHTYLPSGLDDGGEQQQALFIRQMCTELRIVGAKCDSLAEIVMETFFQGT